MKSIGIFLVLLILTSGCLEKKEISYVCHDGSVVFDPENCPELEKPAPEKIIITKYVCPNGEVVDKAEECELITSTTTTTLLSTTTSTTALEETTSTITLLTTTTIPTSTTTTSSTTPTSTSTTTSTTTTIQETNACVELGCPAGTEFVGSTGGTKYHYCDCHYVNNINPGNLICFGSKEEAQEQGYSSCKSCKPPE